MSDLRAEEIRVLGALLEKQATTPEYYPLTLNSLVAACNQKSNRWPVVSYSEDDVRLAIDGLKAKGMAAEIIGNGRVSKYAQRYTEKINLGRRESAILCVLLLRGPQTLGEIKGRTERVYDFADLDEVETVLGKMAAREDGALAQKLPAGPGMKEPRWAQTLGGPVEFSVPAGGGFEASPGSADRMSALEAEVAKLREEFSELRRQFDELLR
ncbi:MAG TPA: YceH family protein [Bryobacteraceae bacterium]|nr:YceH family protein [Bryobacteraceae bacterium]